MEQAHDARQEPRYISCNGPAVTMDASTVTGSEEPPVPSEPARSVGRLPLLALMMFATSGAALAADQISKGIALSRLLDGPAEFPGPIWFDLVANRGALMGFPLPIWAMVGVAAAVVALAVTNLRTATTRSALGFGLLVGGALGNLVDRFQHRDRFPDHAVVDWIASARLPTFNLADVAIITGIVVVVLTANARSTPRREEIIADRVP